MCIRDRGLRVNIVYHNVIVIGKQLKKPNAKMLRILRFMIQIIGFRVGGLGYGIQGLGFGV